MNNYSDKEYEIFSRLFILNEFSEKNLELLSNLKIGIVGIGGIGCPLSQYLVSSGIKKLIIADGDIVEISNLNRQILFNLNDVGEKKTKAAKNKLKLINNECVIDTLDQNIDSNNLIHLAECSIIVDATDDWNTSKLLNEFCVNNSINFLYSSALKHDIQVILFNNTEAGLAWKDSNLEYEYNKSVWGEDSESKKNFLLKKSFFTDIINFLSFFDKEQYE